MSDTDSDLIKIFQDEVSAYLSTLADQIELFPQVDHAKQIEILHEMNRLAHSMRGAARSVGYNNMERIGHRLEDLFEALEAHPATFSDELQSVVVDSLGLLERIKSGKRVGKGIVDGLVGMLEDAVKHQNSHSDTQEVAAVLPEDDTLDDEPVQPPSPANPITTQFDQELVTLFHGEASEYLELLNDGLLKVEMMTGEERNGLLREMNRYAHSMKGAARAVGFGLIETISHYMEEVFNATLNHGADLTPDMADSLYDGLDLIQNTLVGDELEAAVVSDVLSNLEQIVTGQVDLSESDIPPVIEESVASEPIIDAPPEEVISEKPNAPVPSTNAQELTQTTLMRLPEETLRVPVSRLDQLMAEASELLVARMQGDARQRRITVIRRDLARWQREWRSVRAAYIRVVRRLQEQSTDGAMTNEMSALFRFLESNQRYLAEANRNMALLAQISAQDNMQLTTITEALQTDVANLRMMPFETIVSGFQRVVRDLARDTNKQVTLEITGARVEIDKTVLDALKDPLMHALRNAVDHGIELPAERVAAGKNPVGLIHLIVELRGSEITIQIRDDGRGMNIERIRQRAIERSLVTEAEANMLSEEDVRMLVFHTGFSTTDTVTALSGRGLGMDIVRTRIESLRGRVSLQSTPGQGTTLTLNVPVSLTRIRAIVLRLGDEDYAVPAVMVSRMETVPRDRIYTAEGQLMIELNNRPTPLASLGAILDAPTDNRDEDLVQIVALTAADRNVAFEVDELYSEMELVLKPLGHELAATPYVAGAALLGSGDVIIVLDANDLVRKATGATLQARTRALSRATPAEPRKLRVLVVDDSITTRTLEKNILEAVGFEVHVAIDGEEAWSRLQEIGPDVIISDVEMPNMNGLELARRVKEHPATRDIPLILLTSLGKPEQRQAGLEAGANAYLVKSQFDQGELLETIQRVM